MSIVPLPFMNAHLSRIAASISCWIHCEERIYECTSKGRLRQISLLAEESIDTMRPRSPIALDPGVFAENINTEGIDLKGLPVGTHLRIGETEVEVTQIGKECHNDCAIKKAVGKCVMPTEGIFAVVVKEGVVRPGDEIEVLK